MSEGKITKTEWLLLGITAIFVCVLVGMAQHDRAVPASIETEIQVPQEEIQPDLSPLNLNTATAEELMRLPGIGEELAHRIIEYRMTKGTFRSIEEIMQVSGIGQGKFEALKDRITVEEIA